MRLYARSTSYLVILLAVSTGSAGPVYTWIDRNGITHFSDTPPAADNFEVSLIEVLPPPAAGQPRDPDYYSVIRQAERMQAQRLRSERARAERLRAQAEAERARADALAAQQQADVQVETAAAPYFYPYWPHHGRPHHKHRRPGGHRGHDRAEHGRKPLSARRLPDRISLSPALRLRPLPEYHRAPRN